MKNIIFTMVVLLNSLVIASAKESISLPRCQIVPLANHEVSLQIDGIECTKWHFGSQYPRPFFFPLNGPSGSSLTRVGHPGAAHHDHHRSVWFAHSDVNGKDFWGDKPGLQIKQHEWLAYYDSDLEARMAVHLEWIDESDQVQLEQQMIAAIIPGEEGQWSLEIQTTLQPSTEESVAILGKTNFGLLAVRVAKSISEYFGDGLLTNTHGARRETEVFGKSANWVDYSGPVPEGTSPTRKSVIEGITYFDHPSNPNYPAKWHVREDGWLGASLCFDKSFEVTRDQPLTLRYLLAVHRGPIDSQQADQQASDFAQRPGFKVIESTKKHRQYEVLRIRK